MRCRVSSESSTDTEEDSATKTKVSSSSSLKLHQHYHSFVVSCLKAKLFLCCNKLVTEDAVWIHEEGCSVDRSGSYCAWYRAREWP